MDIIERIYPTQKTLPDFLCRYQDHKLRYEFACEVLGKSGGRILDVACGAGYGSFMLSSCSEHVTGADIAIEAIDWAKKEFQSDGIEFHQISNSVKELDSGLYDAVISFETIEHMPELEGVKFICDLFHVMRPGGTLVMSTPINNSNLRFEPSLNNPYHIREYDFREFRQMVEDAGFVNIEMHGQRSSTQDKLDAGTVVSVSKLMKFKLHYVIPKSIRDWILRRLFDLGNSSSRIVSEDWELASVQIVVACKPE